MSGPTPRKRRRAEHNARETGERQADSGQHFGRAECTDVSGPSRSQILKRDY
jgi:hypothetical protein